MPEWTLADRLRKARHSTGMGQREFAVALEVSAPTYSQWEAGNTKPRDVVAIAKRIELITRIPAAWLLGVIESEPRPSGPSSAGSWAPRSGGNPQSTD